MLNHFVKLFLCFKCVNFFTKEKPKQSRPTKAGNGQRPVGGHVIEASDDEDDEDGSETSEDDDGKEVTHMKGYF